MKALVFFLCTILSPLAANETVVAEAAAPPTTIMEEKNEIQETAPSQDIEKQNTQFQNAIVKTLLSIAAFIFLILFTIWLLRRISQNRASFGSRSSSMQILEKRVISPKTTIYIVEIDGKKVVFSESMMDVRTLYTEATSIPATSPIVYPS
jgi:flagellar biogenesis protein FliO